MDSSEIFGCNQCSKRFDTLGRYKYAQKSMPFQCSECVRSFALRSDLARHVQARHRLGTARHPCIVEGCAFRASRKDNIRQHVRRSHPEVSLGARKPKVDRSRARSQSSPTPTSTGVPSIAQSGLPLESTCVLMQAASAGNINLVQAIFRLGISISIQADDGSTALHCAAKADQMEMVNLLIALGAMTDVVNNKVRTPLHEAILGHCTHTFEILVEERADITEEVLRATIRTGCSEFFQLAWARSNEEIFRACGHELFGIAASSPQTAFMATFLLSRRITRGWISEMGQPTISRILYKNQVAMLECLLTSGKLDPNMAIGHRFRRLIHVAAASGHTGIICLLLGFKTIDPNLITSSNVSALGIAALKGHLGIVEKLLQYPTITIRGKKGSRSESSHPLHLACRGRHMDIIWLMLRWFDNRQFDVDSLDNSGPRRTPLQYAVFAGHAEVVELLLLRQDVDVNRSFGASMTTLRQVAAQRGHAKTLSVLLGDGRVDREDVKNSRDSLLLEAFLGGHWCLVEILFDYESVPLDITRQSLYLATEPSQKRIDILERGLHSIAIPPDHEEGLWHRVAWTGNLSMAMLLLEHAQAYNNCTHPMVDVNGEDWCGRTPLHIAARNGKPGIIELLLHHKHIDINLTTQRWVSCRKHCHQSAMEIVKQGHRYWSLHKDECAYIVNLLLAHGARTALRDEDAVVETVFMNSYEPMQDDPDAVFEEWMSFDEGELFDNSFGDVEARDAS